MTVYAVGTKESWYLRENFSLALSKLIELVHEEVGDCDFIFARREITEEEYDNQHELDLKL